jgi:hypothetical protein
MSDCDPQGERFTRAEAEAIARSEATRDLVIGDRVIRYVAFVEDFADHCRCEFAPAGEGWTKTIRHLRNDERTRDEAIDDARIAGLARNGRHLAAITLYRLKHNAGLPEAKAAVDAWGRHA